VTWRIEYARSAQQAAKKLDQEARRHIRQYLVENVAKLDDPRQLGKPLNGRLSEL